MFCYNHDNHQTFSIINLTKSIVLLDHLLSIFLPFSHWFVKPSLMFKWKFTSILHSHFVYPILLIYRGTKRLIFLPCFHCQLEDRFSNLTAIILPLKRTNELLSDNVATLTTADVELTASIIDVIIAAGVDDALSLTVDFAIEILNMVDTLLEIDFSILERAGPACLRYVEVTSKITLAITPIRLLPDNHSMVDFYKETALYVCKSL